MRELSEAELLVVSGGYSSNDYDGYADVSGSGDTYTASLDASTVGQSTIDAAASAASTMSSSDFNDYATEHAQGFGINIGGFDVSPIFDPFGSNKKYGVKVSGPC